MPVSIESFPVEILGELIFSIIMEDSTPSYTRVRTNMTLVCSQWRAVTESPTQITRSLQISRQRPLQVSFELKASSRDSETFQLIKSFQQVCAHIARWQTVKLNCGHSNYLHRLLHFWWKQTLPSFMDTNSFPGCWQVKRPGWSVWLFGASSCTGTGLRTTVSEASSSNTYTMTHETSIQSSNHCLSSQA